MISEFLELESKVTPRKGGMRRCRFAENVGSKLLVEERGECFCQIAVDFEGPLAPVHDMGL